VTGNAIEYEHLAALLNRSGSPLPLAELHGGLCGLICASGRQAWSGWLDGLLDDCDADSATLAEIDRELKVLGSETFAALSGWTFEFAPLLPDDETDVAERAESLALWCHGFLAGLVIGGVDLAHGQPALSAEVDELVRDFAEISQGAAAADERADEDHGDRALTELVEYVRVGAKFIFEELVAEPESREERRIH
jgi:hypothetical protein